MGEGSAPPCPPPTREGPMGSCSVTGSAEEGFEGSITACQVPGMGWTQVRGRALLLGFGLIHAGIRAQENSSWRME